jgi:DNA polymerase I-like protein with 3'-5' exonuclease and polymerase domains
MMGLSIEPVLPAPPIPLAASIATKRVLITTADFQEYYLEQLVDADGKFIEWEMVCRIPDQREAVRAPIGYKIAAADYSQIEVQIMAWLSQDIFLINAVNSDKDIHCYMAREISSIPYEEFFDAYQDDSHEKHSEYAGLRANVKTVTFGIPYGATARRVSQMTGSSIEEAQALIERYFYKAYVLKCRLDKRRAKALKKGLTRSA